MKIRIGTRMSALALAQTTLVKNKIEQIASDAEVELVEMTTAGDRILDRSLTSFGGKGVFTQELEEALLKDEVDLAVHSAKDLPMQFPEGLGIRAVLARADVSDLFVTTTGISLADLPAGSIVGTSSLRRELQVKEINPNVEIRMLRGNVQTRLRKLKEGQYDGIILAKAGMDRMKEYDPEFEGFIEGVHFERLIDEGVLPAAGQGIIAIEAKEGRFADILAKINDPEARKMLYAERGFLSEIGGSCNAPAAAYCRADGDAFVMDTFYAPDGKNAHRAQGSLMNEEIHCDGCMEEFGRVQARKILKMTYGKVYLLGAGPGDPGLISRKGLELIRHADVLIYDNLINASLINEAAPHCELIYAGKRSSNHHLKQWETNELLIQKAKEGKTVVRLKGGDPFIFGRGGEEAQELLQAGISFEIVPGISSSYSAPAYAGIPVTHRDYASSFHVITGHESNTKEGLVLDYETIAKEEGTLIFLMGLRNLPNITAQLIRYGKDPKTPAAVVQAGTTSRQRCVVGTLDTINEIRKEAGIQTPAITVVGQVVSLKETLDWFGHQPLFGARVMLTGTPSMCEKQTEVLKKLGAESWAYSLIRTEKEESAELDRAFADISQYSWIVFTSANGVDIFFEKLKDLKKDIRSLASLKIAVIGSGTEKALTDRGIVPDFVPRKFSSKDLVNEWLPILSKEDNVLLMRAEEASKEVPEALDAAGIAYTAASLYHTAVDTRKGEDLNRLLGEVDYVTLASSSAAKAFAGMLEADTKLPKLICIGPVTEKTAKECGLPVYASAKKFTAEGMAEIILNDYKEN